MLICAILMFCGIFPVTAFADNATVTSGTMYSYFQTFSSSGSWVDVQTPSHWITQTGEVAYCLQTQRDSPYNAGYHTVDGSDYYNTRVLTGLYAILQNGYPMKNGGYSDEQARYATANAIRFWMAENYCDGMPQYLNLNVKNAAHGWRDADGRPIMNWQSLLISWEPLERKYSKDEGSRRDRYDLNPGVEAENDPRWDSVHFDIGE